MHTVAAIDALQVPAVDEDSGGAKQDHDNWHTCRRK
jgi:hypothetical protein